MQLAEGTALARDIERDIVEELHRGLFTLGPWVERFEQAICDKYSVRHCIGVNSGTDALVLSLKAMGVGQGDLVLTVANSFIATAGAIVAAGASPRFVDVGLDYFMDLTEAGHRCAKAIIPVHLTGLAQETSLAAFTVNDACQAIGAEYDGKSVAKFNQISAFSLHPLKNLHVLGDGGFVTTDDDSYAAEVRLLRNHGLQDRDHCVMPGANSRLDSLHAIAAWHGLKTLDDNNDIRRWNAALYDSGLAGLEPDVTVPWRDPRAKPVYHTYVVMVERRNVLQAYLAEKGIETRVHYPIPIHLQEGYRWLGYKRGDLPQTEHQADHIISLPVHEYLSDDQVEYVIERVRAFYQDEDEGGHVTEPA